MVNITIICFYHKFVRIHIFHEYRLGIVLHLCIKFNMPLASSEILMIHANLMMYDNLSIYLNNLIIFYM